MEKTERGAWGSMEALEKKLDYVFRDRSLLSEALNHSSYANEHRGDGGSSNERLEFLGDAILGFVTAEHLFKTYPNLPEGDLTRIRAALVCEQSLYEVARRLELGPCLKLGRGEEAGGGRQRQSILADAVEAIFAAIYLDSDMATISRIIHRLLLDHSSVHVVEERRDYKTALQELVQREEGRTLVYELLSETGPDHNKTFTFRVLVNGIPEGEGSGHSKKEAEQSAARDALHKLEQK